MMTDCSLHELMKESNVQKSISYQTTRLGFISVNLPIRLREVVGVYGLITSTLAVAQIPIHSFHTIGGEILILVKNEDLFRSILCTAGKILEKVREKAVELKRHLFDKELMQIYYEIVGYPKK